jgi:hypothetical protein
MNTTTFATPQGHPTPRQLALVAGISSVIMFGAAMVAEMLARQQLIVAGDATATAHNIIGGGFSFRMGMLGFFTVMLCDVLVAWAMYLFLQPAGKQLSLLAAWLRLMYTAVFGISLTSLMSGYRLLTDGQAAAVFQADQLHAQAMLHFNAFNDGWAIAFLFFGLHLLLLGYLIIKSTAMPKVLGILLMAAGTAYLIDNFAKLLLPNYAEVQGILTALVVLPSIVGELGLAIWLLVRGGKSVARA